MRGSSSCRAPAEACALRAEKRASSCHHPVDAQSMAAIAAHFAKLPCSLCNSPLSMPETAEDTPEYLSESLTAELSNVDVVFRKAGGTISDAEQMLRKQGFVFASEDDVT